MAWEFDKLLFFGFVDWAVSDIFKQGKPFASALYFSLFSLVLIFYPEVVFISHKAVG